EYYKIAIAEPNHEYYIWNIPDNFTNFKEPYIIWEDTPIISVSRKPIIKIIPDLNTGKITDSSFKAFSEGYFLTNNDDASINIQLEMRDDNGVISYSKEGTIYANIKYNKIDINHPVTVTDSSLFFPGSIDYKKIDIHVANSVNNDVFGVVSNLIII
ncbi:MAG TPA: hypothetical protein P5513_06805, partial [Candidatus Diapherotrites archaeon]|nr:hypothetical protein [Candidatus Diapherotrites archaeon]